MKYTRYELILKKSKSHESKYEYNLTGPSDVYEFMTKIIKIDQMPEEHTYVICVDTKLNTIGFAEVSHGDLNSAMLNPREVFKYAFLMNSAGIFLVHQHPSGDPSPSRDDISVTKQIAKGGKFLGIRLLDHVIIGDGRFVSMRTEGYYH